MNKSEPNTGDHGVRRRWQLRMMEGRLAKNAWPVTSTPLLIGRGLGCHICIEDHSVSRLQCEVLERGGEPWLVNRSNRVSTKVNGETQVECKLYLGDCIEFSSHRLFVDALDKGSSLPIGGVAGAPTTQSISDSIYLNPKKAPTDPKKTPDYASNLLALLNLQRNLSQSASLDELVSKIKHHFEASVDSLHSWIVLKSADGEDLFEIPPDSPTRSSPFPTYAISQVIDSGAALRINEEEQERSICAAPLVHGNEVFGALAIEIDGNREPGAANQLDYVQAVALGVSPLILASERMEQMQRDLGVSNSFLPTCDSIVGTSKEMQNLRSRLKEAAPARGSVLILGETGVGKELAARMLHELSPRSAGPYVVVNCAAIPDELFESEVFGHEPGAFTGATGKRIGLFEQAHGGTLFLDEVSELSPMNQAKLLRVAETNVLRRLGSQTDIAIDVRIVSATNRPLPDSSEKHLRIDLFYRLSAFSIWIPPLRERTGDIPVIAEHFRAQFAPHSTHRPSRFSNEASLKMINYHWRGNVREMKNVVERACYAAESQEIQASDILVPKDISRSKGSESRSPLKELEREHLLQVLADHDNNVADAAKALGIASSTMYYKLKRHGIKLRNPK